MKEETFVGQAIVDSKVHLEEIFERMREDVYIACTNPQIAY